MYACVRAYALAGWLANWLAGSQPHGGPKLDNCPAPAAHHRTAPNPLNKTYPQPPTRRHWLLQGFEEHSLQAGVDFVAASFEDISFPNLKAHFVRQVSELTSSTTTSPP